MSEWKKMSFEDVCIVDKECLTENTDPNYNFYYISLSDVEKGRLLNTVQNIFFKNAPSRARRILHNKDVLMATVRPNLQAFAILGEKIRNMIASTGFAVLSEKNNNSTDYIYQYLYTEHATRQINNLVAGSNYPAISSTDVKRLRINIPTSLSEQRKIAKILSTVDAVIEKTEAAIAKYKAIKAGMMHDLFTRGIDLSTGKLRPSYADAPELYKESELGWVPKEWDVEQLVNLTTQIGDGIHTTPNYSNITDFYFINGNNLSDGKIVITNNTLCVNEDEYKKHFKELNNRTILYSINGTIGNIAFFNYEKVILGKSAAYISCDKKINLNYMFFIMQTEEIIKFYENEMTGSTIKNLSLTSIRNTPIAYPKNNIEQDVIAKNISCLDKKIKIEQISLSKYQQLKQGLMSDLLTGKIRVKYEEEQPEAV